MRWVSILSLLLFSVSALAELENTCGEANDGIKYTYCISKTKGSKSRDILYALHGGQGDHLEWTYGFGGVREAWEKRGFEPPIVISVSFGPIWMLLKKNSKTASGLMDLLQKTVYPKLERLALGQNAHIGRRMIIGGSMGGFNSAQLLFNSPDGTYAKAVILCPAIMDLSPWASETDIARFIAKEKASARTVRGIIGVIKAHVPDKASWDGEVDPVVLAVRRLKPESTTSVLITTNRADHDFIAGGRGFAQSAVATGAPVTWRDWEGDHCHLNEEAIAEFLAK